MWSPSRTRPRLTLAGQLLALQMIVVIAVLAVVSVVSVRQSTAEFADQQGTRMRSVAEYLANIDVVRDEATSDFASGSLAPAVDRALSLSGASVVSVASPQGLIIASSDPSRVGQEAVLGDSRVQQGRGWTGDLTVDGQRVVAGHAPVIADDGTLVGLSIAQQTYPSTWTRLASAGPDLLTFLGIGALFGAAGSWLLSRFIKRRTRGLEPSEIATLADHREALLHSVREGVIAVDTEGRVTVANDGARALLRLGGNIVGLHVADLGLDAVLTDALTSADELRDAVLVIGDRVLVVNQLSASSRGRGIGTVTTMRDRTELASLESRLTSTVSITDTLRAQTHEFANQLHTISGLVQLQEYDEVRTLVGTLTAARTAQTDFVSSRIADRSVAALVIAKSSVAGEAGIELRVDTDSSIPVLPAELSADVTAILGNLIDNGLDAVRDVARRDREGGWVEVLLETDGASLVLTVTDDGDGVPSALRDAIFARGVSTKPDVPGGRGLGLPLVQLLCRQRGGEITLTDRPGGGAVFVVVLPHGGRDA